MKSFLTLAAVFLFGISTNAMSEPPKTKTFKTPDGPVTSTTQIVDTFPQKVTVATSKEVMAFNVLASKASGFVSTYLPGTSNPSLKDFDNAFYLWKKEKTRRYTQQQVVEILGAYLGNKFISDFEMEWVLVNDQYGTDYAVRSKKYEVTSFPFSSVAKRIESNQHEFVVGLYHTVKQTMASGDYKAR